MKLSRAISTYLYDKSTAGYADRTIKLYTELLSFFCNYLGDQEIETVRPDDIVRFFHYLRFEYVPTRTGKFPSTEPLADSTIDNYWKATRSLFHWAYDAFNIKRPDTRISQPKYMAPVILPFSKEEVAALLTACDFTSAARSDKRKSFHMKRPNAVRDKAIILCLLDTGIRIGELLRIEIRDVNFQTGQIEIVPFGSGQKTKPRAVYVGKSTRRMLNIYLSRISDLLTPEDHLFDTTYTAIRNVLRRLGERTGIKDVHPHRFRHTFAVTYLKNGGDVISLAQILGHSDLGMVKRYLALASSDVKAIHKRVGPVDNWRL